MEINLINNIQNSTNYDIAVKRLSDFKDKLKKQRKLLAKKYHPDLNKTVDPNHMGKINDAYDILMKMDIQKPQPVQVVRFYTNAIYTYAGSTTTTGTGGSWGYY